MLGNYETSKDQKQIEWIKLYIWHMFKTMKEISKFINIIGKLKVNKV